MTYEIASELIDRWLAAENAAERGRGKDGFPHLKAIADAERLRAVAAVSVLIDGVRETSPHKPLLRKLVN